MNQDYEYIRVKGVPVRQLLAPIYSYLIDDEWTKEDYENMTLVYLEVMKEIKKCKETLELHEMFLKDYETILKIKHKLLKVGSYGIISKQ